MGLLATRIIVQKLYYPYFVGFWLVLPLNFVVFASYQTVSAFASLWISSFFMRERSVLGCSPKITAAPFGPSIRQFVWCKTLRMRVRSNSSSVNGSSPPSFWLLLFSGVTPEGDACEKISAP